MSTEGVREKAGEDKADSDAAAGDWAGGSTAIRIPEGEAFEQLVEYDCG